MIDTIHIAVCMKPTEGNFAQNAIEYGVAGLNIGSTRVATDESLNGGAYAEKGTERDDGWGMQRGGAGEFKQPEGRFPANVILDGSDEVEEQFPETHGANNKKTSKCTISKEQIYSGGWKTETKNPDYYADGGGSASRFFKECEPDD